MLHHTQWLKPYPTADYHNTFIGYVPHSTILQPTYRYMLKQQLSQKYSSIMKGQSKVGLLLGKYSKSFRRSKAMIEALIADGFTLHTTCTDCHDTTTLPEQVIRHNNVGPLQFIQILQNKQFDISFLLGFGYPYDSPSPIEALVNGVAFINPIANHVQIPPNETAIFPSYHSSYPLRSSQHVPLQSLGTPYVYNVHLSNITEILLAANMATQYRFHSYIPPEYHPLSLITRVCTVLLEDDTLCTCSQQTRRMNYNRDCRPGSHTIRKSTTGNYANGVGTISFN
jgi:alpha-1,3(6)-mannosylglycoprotein beta-1,6-N-acetyl-glucosaminyltransferase